MIEFDNVTHYFGDRAVLTDITCRWDQQRIAIIGANGSGKSTLARMVNGLAVPTEGRVRVDGLDPSRDGREVRRRVSFLFSDPDAQIVMPTVGEDIAFSLRRHSLTKDERIERTEAILHTVGLPGYAEHPAHLLSSGQKQLLALATILVTEPDILIADEPTTLLDLRHTREIRALLATLTQQVIVVTHDLDLIGEFDRAIVLDEGRIVADGAPAECVTFYRRLMGDL
jgi:biotin transport system ATP-binding protein